LVERAKVTARTKSNLIREAIDEYLNGTAVEHAQAMEHYRSVITEVAGSVPRLPAGAAYVDGLRSADRARDEALESRWRQ